MKTVSILIPARDEAEGLTRVLTDIAVLKRRYHNRYSFQVVVIDDHSCDYTVHVAKSFRATVTHNPLPPGKGNALRTGFPYATGQYIVTIDADYSHRVEDIPRLIRALKPNVGLVIGSRMLGGSDEFMPIRVFGNKLFTFLIRRLLAVPVTDALSGLKAMPASLIRDVVFTCSEYEIEVELIALALRRNLAVREVPSRERARLHGKAKSKLIHHGLLFLKQIFVEYIHNHLGRAHI